MATKKKIPRAIAMILAIFSVCCGGTPEARRPAASADIATVQVTPAPDLNDASKPSDLPGRRRQGLLGLHLSRTNEGSLGVVVIYAMPEYPAQVAGIVPGDLILAVGGIEVNSYLEVVRAVARHGAGDPVAVRFKTRSGRTGEVTLVLAEMPAQPAREPGDEPPAE